NGCLATDDLVINVEEFVGIYIPNAMGGNGSNAQLELGFNPAIRKVNLFRIADRWGELLHETRNALPGDSGLSWDGRFKGKLVNPGVYIWAIEVELVNGAVVKKTGDLTVVR
ncbi:MAG: gliding motility-associated C-terminal domain-containing protein, partial [Saprospiraceae bacterium]|nr:gliding motility-associated C-terminal domain-containing protein [Saprospiraceae bacterium]